MESQPQNPEFRINPENFHLCYLDTFMQWKSSNHTRLSGPFINTLEINLTKFHPPQGIVYRHGLS